MIIEYEELIEGIWAKCQKQHWFGSDHMNPRRYKNILEYDPNFDIQSTQLVPPNNLKRFGFVFPPASEDILQATETALGFPLPSLLRTIYARVANGGFGPGAGIPGTFEGYGKPGASIYQDSDDTIVAQYHTWSKGNTIDLAEYVKHNSEQQKRINLQLPYGVWPAQIIPLCDMGCVQQACVHSDGRMFHVAPIDSNEVYWLYQMPWTFEEWLWRWVRGESLMVRYVE